MSHQRQPDGEEEVHNSIVYIKYKAFGKIIYMTPP